MKEEVRIARIAGLIYLIVVVTGIFNLGILPSNFLVKQDAIATFQNITENLMLFKYWILTGIACYIAFLFLPLVLYRLLNSVNKNYALAMVTLVVVSVPISLTNIIDQFTILTLVEKAEAPNGMDLAQVQEQVMFLFYSYNNGLRVVSIFWGLWLFPFGYLVYRSSFLPKILGVLLMFGCFGYLINFLGNFLFEGYSGSLLSEFITRPGSIGEIGICLWLLVVGVRTRQEKQKTPD
ncbi:DUF4386 domain-containing protein [Allomuricauda sp. M10]|uniref:DUF4386 domain-containing protein n=1 Tax=Allomuricauda sp. M10 TaxID=2683292 RepID=UPI001D18EB2A|nr:DUF4386 domain-containing protein [Muricauda sp. M10]